MPQPENQNLMPYMVNWPTTKDVAKQTGKSQRSIQVYISRGLIRAVKIGRDFRVNPADTALVQTIKLGRPRKS